MTGKIIGVGGAGLVQLAVWLAIAALTLAYRDQVLSAFDEPTRQSFKSFLHDLSGSLDGRGQDLSDSIANAGVATDELTKVVVALDSEEGSVRGLVHDTGVVLRALGNRQADLQGLITAGQQVFAANPTSMTAPI